MVDTVHAVETPEGVRLALRTAGPVPRALAYLVDASLRAVFYLFALVGVALWGSGSGDLQVAAFLLLFFAVEWFYPVCFEVWARGQTPGKRAVSLRVVNADGTRVRWSASILRNLLLAADWVPGTYAAGLIAMLTSGGFRRLGDLAAGTLVVHSEAPPGPGDRAPERPPLAPPVALTVEEQRAVVAFSERAPHLSEQRAAELAALATPLYGPGDDPRERLHRIGAWLLGRTGSGPV